MRSIQSYIVIHNYLSQKASENCVNECNSTRFLGRIDQSKSRRVSLKPRSKRNHNHQKNVSRPHSALKRSNLELVAFVPFLQNILAFDQICSQFFFCQKALKSRLTLIFNRIWIWKAEPFVLNCWIVIEVSVRAIIEIGRMAISNYNIRCCYVSSKCSDSVPVED